MPRAYVATLGERPEAISIAFDKLRQMYPYDLVIILHTSAILPGIARAQAELRAHLDRILPVHFVEITFADGKPIQDMTSQQAADDYYRAVLESLYHWKRRGYDLHLMISGGRKTMSALALMAAALIFDPERDVVWSVLSSPKLVNMHGQMTIPPGMADAVNVVPLPLVTARLAPGVNPTEYIDKLRRNKTSIFLSKLNPAPRRVAEALQQNPLASNDDLAAQLSLSSKTVANHLRQCYDVMQGVLDGAEGIHDRQKRRMLIQLLTES